MNLSRYETTMSNDTLRRFALILAIVVLSAWGLIVMIMPDQIVGMFSNEPVNHSFAGMMGAGLLGLALISFSSVTHWMSAERALGIAMTILVLETGYLMLGAGVMLVTPLTTISLVAAAAVAFFLVF